MCNGILCHAFEPLEGSNILWHIVGPHPAHFLSLSYYFAPNLVLACLVGCVFFCWFFVGSQPRTQSILIRSLDDLTLRDHLGKREKLDLRSTNSILDIDNLIISTTQ